MKAAVLIFAKKKNSAAKAAATDLSAWLKKHSYRALDLTDGEDRIPTSMVKEVSLGVVIGGDGTFLTLVRRLERKDKFPLLGINLGTLGFITEVRRDQMLSVMDEVLKKKAREESRPLFEVELWRGGKCIFSGTVFNDAVLNKDARTSMLKFDVMMGAETMYALKADGCVIATPTGSTAYSLSVGGPLVHPSVSSLLLAPLAPHSLSVRPAVLPADTKIELRPKEFVGAAYLTLDGQVTAEVKPKDLIKIFLSEQKLRLVRPLSSSWPETLRSKLHLHG